MIRLLTRFVAWAVLAYLVVPLVVIIGCSLTKTSYLVFPPKGLTFDWYLAMLQDRSGGNALCDQRRRWRRLLRDSRRDAH